jgi:hypothetical protein
MALEASTLRLLRARSISRPDVRLIAWQGRPAVAKDWGGKGWLLRPHARACLAREWRALERLAGLPGVPEPLARLPDAIVVSQLPGEPLGRLRLRRLPAGRAAYFAALEACVERMHARGVVHLDLRQRRNVLCGAAGEPGVLDFEAALTLDPARAWTRPVLAIGRRLDRLALLKLKARYAPFLLSSGERRLARATDLAGWVWPSRVLHRGRVALRRLRRAGGS